MKVNRKIIEIDEELCNGCGQCVPSCAEGALQVVDGKARLVKDIYCDGLGACLGECPTGALNIIEREAEEFDDEAVEEYLKSKEEEKPNEETMACGCPSAQIQSFVTEESREKANIPALQSSQRSELSHWPVQIRLIPTDASFLKGADLLVTSDCAPVAYPEFHRDFIKGRVVMVGCPKFDDGNEYVGRFAEIFKNADIKSVTIVVMDVPCCQGMPMIIEKAMELAHRKIPIEKIIISGRGDVLDRQRMAA